MVWTNDLGYHRQYALPRRYITAGRLVGQRGCVVALIPKGATDGSSSTKRAAKRPTTNS